MEDNCVLAVLCVVYEGLNGKLKGKITTRRENLPFCTIGEQMHVCITKQGLPCSKTPLNTTNKVDMQT